MENPSNNKIISEVFARYIRTKIGWEYNVILPKQTNEPKFDALLVSEGHENLLLQLKQPIIFQSVEYILSKSTAKVFDGSPILIKETVKKAEEKYKERAKDLILILHLDEGYFIPSDYSQIDRNDFICSTFKGIYMVSPECEFWKDGKEIQKEFVCEIKNAF